MAKKILDHVDNKALLNFKEACRNIEWPKRFWTMLTKRLCSMSKTLVEMMLSGQKILNHVDNKALINFNEAGRNNAEFLEKKD